MLNLGSRKLRPESVEDLILRTVTVADVGVCSIENADGIEELCIAVSNPRHGDEELLRRVSDAFREYQIGRFHIVKLTGVPRTPNGKLQRKRLKKIVAPAVLARSQGPR